MARPRLNIDPKLVQDLAALGCKASEISIVVGCSADTIEKRFSEQLQKGRENLKISLRRWQLEAAKKGNVTMQIWLGKQMLGQTDKMVQVTDINIKPVTSKEVETILKEDPFLNAKEVEIIPKYDPLLKITQKD